MKNKEQRGQIMKQGIYLSPDGEYISENWYSSSKQGWMAACESQQNKIDALVDVIEYAISGISPSESKTECRHCALSEALEKYKGME